MIVVVQGGGGFRASGLGEFRCSRTSCISSNKSNHNHNLSLSLTHTHTETIKQKNRKNRTDANRADDLKPQDQNPKGWHMM